MSGIGKHEAMKALDLEPSKKFVLSFGGSGGQKSLNQTMLTILTKGLWPDNVQLLHVTGSRHYESFIKTLDDNGIILSEYVRIEPYYYGMPIAMNASDLVVTSGGAITLAEISAVGLPSILIPKSYTAENHQEYNVRAFEKAGAAIVILEKDLNSEVLAQEIDKLLRDEDRLALMSKNSRILGKPEAADTIVNEIILMLNN
jgi:UDP-N-acetylglucosamine--N-acetylmuramyl-(pentapeptide) pyrophosphoryl-undecaprenol N-acetylglucosamine transferase